MGPGDPRWPGRAALRAAVIGGDFNVASGPSMDYPDPGEHERVDRSTRRHFQPRWWQTLFDLALEITTDLPTHFTRAAQSSVTLDCVFLGMDPPIANQCHVQLQTSEDVAALAQSDMAL